MARRRGGVDDRPLPARPYRDTVVVYGIMAVVLVVIAAATGGSLVRAVGAGIVFFVLATAWSWWRFRTRIREREAREALEPATSPSTGRPAGKPEPDSQTSATNGAGNGNGRVGGGR
jgi:hypothetical protein